jgi:[ribosomal protein S5]-alanine N-acetyltransferase
MHDQTVLETRRLRLEPLTAAHAPLLFEPLRDERLYRYEAVEAPASIEELVARCTLLEKRRSPDGSERWLNWVVRLHDGSVVGRMQATVRSDHTLIGYDIFVPYWRNGYGKEACAAMLDFLEHESDIDVFRAFVDTENAASIALLESLGFTRMWTGPSDDMPGRTDHRYDRTSMT